MNGTVEILKEIGIAREVLAGFGQASTEAEAVTGETTWEEIRLILGGDWVAFTEFLAELEHQLGKDISDEVVATNRRLEDICSLVA